MEFIRTNRVKQNKNINKLIFVAIYVGPAVAVGVYFGAFPYISYRGCLIVSAVIGLIYILDSIILKKDKGSYLTVYAGLLGVQAALTIMARAHLGIYLSLFLVPFLSLFYCEKRVYLFSSAISYAGLLLINVMIAPFNAALRPDMTPISWFVGQVGGYTIEFAVMLICGLSLNTMVCSHFRELYETHVEADTEKRHKEQIFRLSNTDILTNLPNRLAFTSEADKLEQNLPDDLTIVQLDINGLKQVNDNLGHIAGDQLICAAATCIDKVFSAYGTSYRTGGDEFIALLRGDVREEELTRELDISAAAWRGSDGRIHLSISCGFAKAKDHPDEKFGTLLKMADDRMYEQKRKYYSQMGIDRRMAGK